MATSGTIQEAIRTGYRLQIAWEVNSQSVANNTSSVTAKVQLVSTGSSYTINSSASKSGSLTINGTRYTFSFSAALSGNQTKTLYTKTVTVAHAANGTKTCSFSATAGINVTLGGTYYGNVTASGSGVFNTIARASSISSVTSSVSVTGSNAVTVAITRASSSFTHKVVFTFGSYSKTTEDVGTSTSYTIPQSWLNAIPNATSGTAKVTVTTYSGSTKIGSTVSKNFTLTVPSTVIPIISAVTLTEAVSGLAAAFGGYVQNKSRIKASITAAGALSSTVKTYKTTIQSASYSGASFTSGILRQSGTSNVTIKVTDSRGRSASVTRSITVNPYSAPKISGFTGTRCLENGTENYDGTYLKASVKYSISTVGNKNTTDYKLEYKAQNSDTWTALTNGTGYAVDTDIISANAILDVDSSYDLRLTVTDYFGTVQSVATVPTAFTLLDFNASGKGVAFGKVSEEDKVEVNLPMDIYQPVYMGGARKSDAEKNIYFQATEGATNPHNCKLYGGNGESITSIGFYDTARGHGILRYLTGTKNLVVDGNMLFTRGNGGDEFVSSDQITHGETTGRVQMSNGLLIQWGRANMTPVANTPTALRVNFPVAYTSEPFVSTSAITSVPGTVVLGHSVADVETTGFDAVITRTGTASTGLLWLAVGYKA